MLKFLMKGVAVCTAAMFLGMTAPAMAEYPERAIRIIVPYPAGGGTDTLARQISQQLSESWGQPVVVENRPGASGITGAEVVATSAPDGYTLLMSIVALAQLSALHESLPFDVAEDFAPLAEVARSQNLLVVPKSFGIETWEQFVERVTAEPAQHSYGSYGAGTSSHIYGELLKIQTGLDLVHVPYRGAAPLITDVLGDMVTLGIVDTTSIRPHLESDRFNTIAVTGGERSPLAPDAPTLGELGLEGFDSYGWFGLFAPAGVPEDILDKLSTELVGIIRSDAMVATMESFGLQPGEADRHGFSEIVVRDLQGWSDVIGETGITLE